MFSHAALPLAPVAALLAALTVPTPSPAPVAVQPAGSIFVSTLPAGADVWIDGTYVGRSPTLAGALAAGKHSVTLTKTGWTFRELDVDVRAGETELSTVELTAQPGRGRLTAATGSYVVRGIPRGAKVLVDGLPAPDATAPSVLSAGAHRVVLVMQRGRVTMPFEVFPDTTTVVVLRAPADAEAQSAVVAPAALYLPAGAYAVEGSKIVVRYDGHVVVARFGERAVRYDGATVSFAGAPKSIAGKLYLPLDLLQRLRGGARGAPL